jgi:ubiquinone/menaquinone biosynthesis C-methylase UbiE
MRLNVATSVVLACVLGAPVSAQRPTHGRLFPPEDLGVLESPDRDEWQHPERIMDALAIGDGSRVADLGAGGGWFTIRLARRVGPNGVVYAEDIQPQMITSIERRVTDQGLTNVETRLGTVSDPRLPPDLDAVLIVDTYPQFTEPVAVLRHVADALATGGRLGIVDFRRDGAGGPGPPLDERLDSTVILRDASDAGQRLLREETFLRYQYLLVFERDR